MNTVCCDYLSGVKNKEKVSMPLKNKNENNEGKL